MKTEISRDSYQPEKRYSGVYQQQGRMLTDADWNELVEILKERLNDALKDVVGNGSPLHRNIVNNETDPPKLQWGYLHVDGIQGLVRPDEGATLQPAFEYDHQQDFPSAPRLPDDPADYVLYADVWERTVTQLMDERLRDKGLHGADTCSRKQIVAQIKWCLNGVDPEEYIDNPTKGNADLTATLLRGVTQPDPCDPCANTIEVDSNVGNYLFRVEVHDVKGPANAPEEITLKWSSENGAEQCSCSLKDADGNDIPPPARFTKEDWAYEFFDEISEKHLGVHHANPDDWKPTRHPLKSEYNKPVEEPNHFVRRWDGYCILKKDGSWGVDEEFDRIQSGPDSLPFTTIADGKLTVSLNAQTFTLKLNSSFVAGDFWLADVREAEHKADSVLIENKAPQGIEHHYLTLGKVVGGVLLNNPEADRKYAFPPLTEMTRLFMAGGDGQEIVPGDPLNPLPQPLRVGVANGEWPVEGATVRFHDEDGGSLNPVTVLTNAEGIAESIWTPNVMPNTNYQVKATLVDPDHASDPTWDLDPPVYFYASLITANQVAYDNPTCTETPSVNSLLEADLTDSWPDFDGDGYSTVKDVLDVLLCKLKAKHIPYTEPTCVSPPSVTVKSLLLELESLGLDFDDNGQITISDILDTILCKLRARHIPYDPTYCNQQHPSHGWGQVKTVQEAINKICEIFNISKDCYDFLDELRSNGIVRNADGEMGFVVTVTQNPLKVNYTGGVAYVAGCRFEIGDGTITVDKSTTHQTLVVNEKGQVELFIKRIESEKYAPIAIISTYKKEITRIFDTRFDITHLDEKVEQNFQRTATARIDRRQFVPLLAYSIKGLEYRDGQNRNFPLTSVQPFDQGHPYGLASDGDNIWVSNFYGPEIAKIPHSAEHMDEVEFISLTNDINAGSWNVAYDGCCLWFTLFTKSSVVRLNPKNLERRVISVDSSPRGIAFDGDFIWVCNHGSNTISIIDVETCQIVRTVELTAAPWHVAFDGRYMWVAANNHLYKVEKPWGDLIPITDLSFNRGYLTFDGTHIWVSSRNAALVKVDVVTGVPQFNVDNIIKSTQTIAFDGTFLWAFDNEHMYKIDPQNKSPVIWESPLDDRPFVSLFDGTHLWISTNKGVLKKLV